MEAEILFSWLSYFFSIISFGAFTACSYQPTSVPPILSRFGFVSWIAELWLCAQIFGELSFSNGQCKWRKMTDLPNFLRLSCLVQTLHSHSQTCLRWGAVILPLVFQLLYAQVQPFLLLITETLPRSVTDHDDARIGIARLRNWRKKKILTTEDHDKLFAIIHSRTR